MPETISDIFFSQSGARNRSGNPNNRSSRVPSSFESFIGLGAQFAGQFLPPVISGSIIRGVGFFNSLLLGDPIPDRQRKEDTISAGTDYPSFPIDERILQVSTENLGIRQGTVTYNIAKFGKFGSIGTQIMPVPDIDGVITKLQDDGSLLLGRGNEGPKVRVRAIPENEFKNESNTLLFGDRDSTETNETTARFSLSDLSRYAANRYFAPCRFYIDSMNPPNASYSNFGGSINNLLSRLNFSVESISFPGKSVSTFEREITSDFPTTMAGKISYPTSLTLTIRCSNDMSEYQFFMGWLSSIFYNPDANDINLTEKRNVNFNYGCMNFFRDYVSTMKFSLLNVVNQPIYKVSLINCYPTEVSSIDASQDASDIAKFSVTLTYQRWIEEDFTEIEKKSYQLKAINDFQNVPNATLNDYTSLRTVTNSVNSYKQNPVKNRLVPTAPPNIVPNFTNTPYRLGGFNTTNFGNLNLGF